MRKISRVVEKKIFRRWLEGCTYREIGPKCGGVSLAAISKVIHRVREKTPDIDALRQLNLVLKRGDTSVFDAIRGGKVLDRVNELGVSLDDLEAYVKTVERVSSDKGAETERFVDSAMKLIRLEAETGKPYGAVITDFEEKQAKVAELEQTRAQLERRIAQLHHERDTMKEAFEAQGLGWAEGMKLLRHIRDLMAEHDATTKRLIGLKATLKENHMALKRIKHVTKRQRSLRNTLKAEIHELQKARAFYLNWKDHEAPKIWRYQDNLQERTQALQKEITQLEAYIAQFQEKKTSAEARVDQLERQASELATRINELELKRKEIETKNNAMNEDAAAKKKRIVKSCHKRIANATMEAKTIIKEAEEKRAEIIAGSKAANTRLKAENELLKAAGVPMLKQLREERKRLEEAEAAQQKKKVPFLDNLRLPKIKSLKLTD